MKEVLLAEDVEGAEVVDENGEICRLTVMKPGDKKVTENSLRYLENHEKWMPNEPFIKIFHDEVKHISISNTHAGILFKLMPHIAFTSCLLTASGRNCADEALCLNDIADIIGADVSYASKLIKEMCGLNLLYKGKKNGKQTQYFVNPYLFFKGSMINKTLKVMFNQPSKK